MALEIFRLVGSIFVDNEEANKSISKTDEKAQGVGKTLAAGVKTAAKWGAGIVAGATAAVAGCAKLVTSATEAADTVDKMSAKIGISKRGYQEWSYVLGQNGMDVDKLQTGMKTLVTQIQSAADGGGKAASAFSELGLSIYDSSGKLKDQETMMTEAMYALADMENGTKKAAMANQLFGKAGSEMMPMLNQGSQGMKDLTARAHELGLVLSDEAVTSGVVLGDTIDDIKRSFTAVATKLGTKFFPLVQKLSDYIIASMPKIEAMFASLEPIVGSLLAEVMPQVMSLAETLLPMLVDLVNQLIPLILPIVQTVLPIISQLLGQILPPLIQIVQTILPVLLAILQPILDLLSGKLTLVIDTIGKQLTSVKNILGGLISFITGVFTGDWKKAWGGVQQIFSNIWEGIKAGFKFPFNSIITGINAFIRGINKIKIPDWVPGVGGKGFNIKTIPLLAAGGVLEKGQTGFLEGNGAEAVVPLHQNRKWISAVASDMNSAIGSTSASAAIEARLADILEAVEALLGMKIYLDTGALVGGLARPLDKKLGMIAAQKARA